MAALKEKYRNEVVPQFSEKLGVKNPMRVPRLAKVVVNMGMGIADKDAAQTHANELGMITGQRPMVTKARKSISNFKLREKMSIGAKVTLRGERMYEFLDRLINAALPRIRDFRGLSANAFDGRGNYSMGIPEQAIFPEIEPNDVGETQGMDVTIVTTTASDDEARELLTMLGVPFAGS